MLRKTSHNREQSTAGRDTFGNYKLLFASCKFFSSFAASVEEKSVEENVEEKIWIAARCTFITGLGEGFPMRSKDPCLLASNLQRQRKDDTSKFDRTITLTCLSWCSTFLALLSYRDLQNWNIQVPLYLKVSGLIFGVLKAEDASNNFVSQNVNVRMHLI